MKKASTKVKPKSKKIGRPVEIAAVNFVGLKLPTALLDEINAFAKAHGMTRPGVKPRSFALVVATVVTVTMFGKSSIGLARLTFPDTARRSMPEGRSRSRYRRRG